MLKLSSKDRIHFLAVTALLAIWICGVGAFGQSSTNCAVRFAVLGDRTGGHVAGIYGEIVSEIERLRPDFVITVGDEIEGYVDDSARISKEWEEYNGLIAPLTMPFYHVPGNHDIWSDFSKKMYRNIIGKPYYSFSRQGIHIIVLDYSRTEASADDFPDDQLKWLEEDLKQNQEADYIIVFFHKPFWNEFTANGKPHPLHSLFVKYGVDAVFSGHYHEYFSADYDGIAYTNVGSSGAGISPDPTGLQYHFVWVTVDSSGIHAVPLKKGSVLPRNQVTVADRRIFNPIRLSGLQFKDQIIVNDELKVGKTNAIVVLKNSYSDYELNDTIRWTVPDGWNVSPEILPVTLAAKTDGEFPFEVQCDSQLFPLPSVSVNFDYAEDKKIEVNGVLRVAREADCNYAKKAPQIDGKIEEECWRNPQFRLFASDGSEAEIEQTEYYYAYDEDNLYLAVRCTESEPDSIRSNATEHDGAVYADDCVGYFLEPDFGSQNIYQIYFNPDGISYDARYWIGDDGWRDGTRDWNGKYDVKTIKGDDYWSIEIKIPLEQFEIKSDSIEKMRLNFRRKQQHLKAVADWQLPLEYDASYYGHLIFKKP